MARPKDIGTAGETAVVRYLQTDGFPYAERRALAGQYDLGDVTGTPGVAWEIKAGKAAKTAGDGQIAEWLDETEIERVNARARFGVLVVQRAGFGAPRAGHWWAVLPAWQLAALICRSDAVDYRAMYGTAPVRMHLSTVVRLLRFAGYGDAPAHEPIPYALTEKGLAA